MEDLVNMGSRIMHYCISEALKQTLDIEDVGFILGNLAPDVYEGSSELKNRSHFMKIDSNGIIYINYDLFYEKYLSLNQSPFHMGYYVHLISDDIWLREIYYKKIKWLPPNIKSKAKNEYYRDFRRLNKKLIDHYSLKLVTIELECISTDIEEIDRALLPKLCKDLSDDFRLAKSDRDEPLEILAFKEVIQVVEMILVRCLAHLEKLTTIR